ncbi:MAG: hypothetical protein FD155_3290 [Bacteroidetes bacterium]|nr:MAG: hypothetical protein FD155_3290 [Bacteroidota bacterium]
MKQYRRKFSSSFMAEVVVEAIEGIKAALNIAHISMDVGRTLSSASYMAEGVFAHSTDFLEE